ncbi:MAG: prepilin peptidase [Candidatus Pacebacteria bacterium]|jgi:leader peptidase (prepilin peptidase) / N-methyltransferase|nr:prepilin peptidase [Candidatus Paceibacterota bacterium]MBT4652680.1 prepilin peptidase [Candidatus Paceibacterota bacterium]MBT6755837.1 prepilin peptidase [Candidatus Paceibacterota bacterium]
MNFFEIMGILVFFFGTAVGSFLNVLIYRSMRGQDWVRARSVCEHCKKKIPWYENIPLFSYLFLKGKCSKCQAKIGLVHPLVEGMTGILFLWWYFAGFVFFKITAAPLLYVQPAFWLFVAVIFVVIFITDLKYMIIPDWTVALLTIGTLAYRFALLYKGEMQFRDFGFSLLWTFCLVSFFFSLWFFTKGKGFGFGDVKLAIPLGLLLGSWQRILVAIFGSFVIGALVGVFLILIKKKKFGQTLPFGPFLLLSTGLSLVWGYAVWAEYVKILVS